MNKYTSYLIAAVVSMLAVNPLIDGAEEQLTTAAPAAKPEVTPKKPFEAFTGKVAKNRVRLRLLPTLDGNIVSELNQGALLLIVDETDDFYAIEPTADAKAYIFRTFVLDNVVEGSRVNVRLKPDIDSPVVTQLSSGDRVEGKINLSNSKWMEISMPKSVRFYVAKDYIERVGDRSYIVKQEKRLQELTRLLTETQQLSQTELAKPFDQIDINPVIANYKKIAQQYADFTDQAARAKEALTTLQNTYNQMKLAYLENTQTAAKELKEKNDKLANELKTQQSQVNQLKQQLKHTSVATSDKKSPSDSGDKGMTYKMSIWTPAEETLYTAWAQEHESGSERRFFNDAQRANATEIKGLLEVYNRPVKNKPGDLYLGGDSITRIPVAFLYSTLVNRKSWSISR